ncbi:MAG: HPr family phosphocarrier protein [Deltaproteobacteria bacterium]|nr:HPr family phosphocarrier protein [Deltaproteobacteria bacterium]
MADPPHVQTQLTLTNKLGLHARAAAVFVRALTGLNAQVTVSWEGRSVNGRSVLELMTLGAPLGSILEIRVSGADAEAALAALTTVVENRFYEE